MVRAVRDALVGAWRKIVRRPSSRAQQQAARGERRYAGAKAAKEAERAEWSRQARAAERPDIHGNMGGGGYGGG
jgi:hypothetical protein